MQLFLASNSSKWAQHSIACMTCITVQATTQLWELDKRLTTPQQHNLTRAHLSPHGETRKQVADELQRLAWEASICLDGAISSLLLSACFCLFFEDKLQLWKLFCLELKRQLFFPSLQVALNNDELCWMKGDYKVLLSALMEPMWRKFLLMAYIQIAEGAINSEIKQQSQSICLFVKMWLSGSFSIILHHCLLGIMYIVMPPHTHTRTLSQLPGWLKIQRHIQATESRFQRSLKQAENFPSPVTQCPCLVQAKMRAKQQWMLGAWFGFQ